MQVYILRDRARTVDLVRRAAAHGYGALVLTVDTAVSGLRLRELRGGVRLPPDLALPNVAGGSAQRAHDGGLMAVVTREFEPSLTPDDIGWLAGLSDLAVVVKGVQRADAARRCIEAGAAAIVVSNHGARQLADLITQSHNFDTGGGTRSSYEERLQVWHFGYRPECGGC